MLIFLTILAADTERKEGELDIDTAPINTGSNGGTVTTSSKPLDITIDINGDIYLANLGNNYIRKITPEGAVITFQKIPEEFLAKHQKPQL